MAILSPKERLIRVLSKQAVDRPPVICPGGMMNAAIVEVMNKTGHTLPAAHSSEQLMAELALDVNQYTGFENIGIPFCMTVEAEVLGSDIDYGTLACEPKILRENYTSVKDMVFKDQGELLRSGRINTIVQAGHRLAKNHPDIPVIGNVTGPVSTAASIIDPLQFLKELRKTPSEVHRVLDYVTKHLGEYARLLIDNGISVISIADPTATGEILGPKMFKEYAIPYLNQLLEVIHGAGGKAIVHICGEMKSVRHLIPELQGDAISTDALVNLRQLKADYPELTVMGNLSTYLLEFGSGEQVIAQTERLLTDKIDIISPACGLSTSTALEKLQFMTGVVKIQ